MSQNIAETSVSDLIAEVARLRDEVAAAQSLEPEPPQPYDTFADTFQ